MWQLMHRTLRSARSLQLSQGGYAYSASDGLPEASQKIQVSKFHFIFFEEVLKEHGQFGHFQPPHQGREEDESTDEDRSTDEEGSANYDGSANDDGSGGVLIE